jgi:hypothetical protein
MSWKAYCLTFATVGLTGVVGCSSGPSKVSIPDVDATAAASGAIDLADNDGDGQISKIEAIAAPSLHSEFDKYDANKDGKIDAGEIETRIAAWTAKGAKVVPISFYVKLDGQPLTDATVVLEPEPFMGGVLAPAESMTSGGGACGPTVSRDLLSKEIPVGVFSGLYRMKVTHPNKTIPAKYNVTTGIGMEIAPDYDFYNRKTFELLSK